MLEMIKQHLKNKLNVNPEEVTLDTKLRGDLGIDSLDLVELVMDIEDELNIEIPDDELVKFTTIGDVVQFLENNK